MRHQKDANGKCDFRGITILNKSKQQEQSQTKGVTHRGANSDCKQAKRAFKYIDNMCFCLYVYSIYFNNFKLQAIESAPL